MRPVPAIRFVSSNSIEEQGITIMATMTEDANVCIELMRPAQIHACRQKADVAFLPLGALEWHGIHGPVGTDAIKAHGVCRLAAEKLGGGAVFPPLVWGVPRDSFFMDNNGFCDDLIAKAYGADHGLKADITPYGGMDRQEQWLNYQRLLRMSLEQIAGFGFRSIYILSGHNPLVHWAKPVAVAFSRATHMAGCVVTTDWGGEFEAAGLNGDHAGKWEMSLMMALAPGSVDLSENDRRPEYRGAGATANAPEANEREGRQWLETCAIAIAQEARWLADNYPKLPPRHDHRRFGPPPA